MVNDDLVYVSLSGLKFSPDFAITKATETSLLMYHF